MLKDKCMDLTHLDSVIVNADGCMAAVNDNNIVLTVMCCRLIISI